MKILKIVNPIKISSLIIIFLIILISFYSLNLIFSFRLKENLFSENSIYFIIFSYLINFFFIIIFSSGVKRSNYKYFLRKKYVKYLYIILIFSFVILVSKFRIIGFENVTLGKNRLKNLLKSETVSYYILNFILIYIIEMAKIHLTKKKYTLLLFLNFVTLLGYSLLLSSRIILLHSIIILLVVKIYYNDKIKISKRILATLLFIAGFYLVYSNGIRDYFEMGYRYTGSKIEWGFFRIIDYGVSTINYTSNIINQSTEIDLVYLFPTLKRIGLKTVENEVFLNRQNYGAWEYNNYGGLGMIYHSLNKLSILYVAILGCFTGIIWKKFLEKKILGLFLYPIFLINILEFTRIFYLGTEIPQILILILLVLISLRRKFFKKIRKYNK